MSEHGLGSGINESSLERKVGGLPVWAWSAVIAGIAYFVYKRRMAAKLSAIGAGTNGTAVDLGTGTVDSTNASSQIDPNTGIPYGNESYPQGPIDSFLAGNPTNTAYPVGSVVNGVPAPVTNEQWARLGGDDLLAKGDDPTLVSNALSKYLTGAALTQGEQAIINSVLVMLGEPPQGVMPINTGGGTTPPPSGGGGGGTTAPPTTSIFTNKTVGVKQTSTLWGLAAENYPGATAKQLEEIVFNTVAKQPQYGNNTVPAQHTVTFYAAGVK
jgi:hypothetical protein